MISIIVRLALAAVVSTAVAAGASKLPRAVSIIESHQQREAASLHCAADPQCTNI